MIQAVLFDIGGTLHTVANSEALARAFARRLIDRLAVYGIAIPAPPDAFARRLHENAEEYKLWSEGTLRELPAPKIWNEYYLRQYCVGEETLAPIAEELSFLYDYERVCNKRRPHLVETMEELRRMGMRMGIVSNIISTSFGPHMVNEYGIAEYMECIVMSSVTGCRKPGAEIFNIAMERLGVAKERTAYVGDTISRDVLGARNAGLALMIQIKNPAVAHRDKAFAGKGPKPDFLIDELYEIPAVIREYNLAHHH
ncbi:MAG TPA: HAD family hydrolase [Clostridia bacterium]|nr:HAD family hydrolase [Clostridia bacterium]